METQMECQKQPNAWLENSRNEPRVQTQARVGNKSSGSTVEVPQKIPTPAPAMTPKPRASSSISLVDMVNGHPFVLSSPLDPQRMQSVNRRYQIPANPFYLGWLEAQKTIQPAATQLPPAPPHPSADSHLPPNICNDPHLDIVERHLDASGVFAVHATLGKCAESSTSCAWFERHRHLFRHYRLINCTASAMERLCRVRHMVEQLRIDYDGLHWDVVGFQQHLERIDFPRLHTLHVSRMKPGDEGLRLPTLRGLKTLQFSLCTFRPEWNRLIEANASSVQHLRFVSVEHMDRVECYPDGLQSVHVKNCSQMSIEVLCKARNEQNRLPQLVLDGVKFINSVSQPLSSETRKQKLQQIFHRVDWR